MAEQWGAYLEEYLTNVEGNMNGACCAAMLIGEDGQAYAAAPVAGDAGWALIFKDPHQEDILQDDGPDRRKSRIAQTETV